MQKFCSPRHGGTYLTPLALGKHRQTDLCEFKVGLVYSEFQENEDYYKEALSRTNNKKNQGNSAPLKESMEQSFPAELREDTMTKHKLYLCWLWLSHFPFFPLIFSEAYRRLFPPSLFTHEDPANLLQRQTLRIYFSHLIPPLGDFKKYYIYSNVPQKSIKV